ncbi:hypothetical protein C8Q76DRAFT_156810 [Earliella scabrosa]|nr:hypothetical protein C8Q76DRAFT_156810 [Earliella scabrosa]
MTSHSTSTGTSPTFLPPLLQVPALDDTFGSVLVGTFVGLLLYGITLHQSYRYGRNYTKDRTILKALVATVLLLETFNTVLSAHICYYYLVSNYFEPRKLLFGSWSVRLLPLSSGLVICTSQSFFARRVIVVGEMYRWVAFVAIALLIGELGFFAAATAEAFIRPSFASFSHVTWLISSGSGMAVTADLLLTTVLIISLRKSRTGVRRTDSMIDVLIMYSINTGLVTGIFNILSLALSIAYPDKLLYASFGIAGTKLYATSLLAALNSRQSLASRGMLTFGVTETVAVQSAVFQIQRRRAAADTIPDGWTGEPNALSTNTLELKPTTLFMETGSISTDERKDVERQA